MTTNDATPREADRAVPEPDADAVDGELREVLATLLRAGPEFIDDAVANIRLVAEQAAAAGDDLDAMLDSVHPRARINWMSPQPDGTWVVAILWWDFPTHDRVDPEMPMNQKAIVGTGPTRMEAVQDAVANAKKGRE